MAALFPLIEADDIDQFTTALAASKEVNAVSFIFVEAFFFSSSRWNDPHYVCAVTRERPFYCSDAETQA
jgi:hypothetical protein